MLYNYNNKIFNNNHKANFYIPFVHDICKKQTNYIKGKDCLSFRSSGKCGTVKQEEEVKPKSSDSKRKLGPSASASNKLTNKVKKGSRNVIFKYSKIINA
jgi:hypothetical protein